jgi:hypothetical protein
MRRVMRSQVATTVEAQAAAAAEVKKATWKKG